MGVVPALDELEEGHLGLGVRLEPTPVEELAFKRGEETLAPGVVVRISAGAHGRAHVSFPTALPESDRRVLTPLVRVVDNALGPPLVDGHVERVEHEFGA